jgi:hypothetical protein
MERLHRANGIDCHHFSRCAGTVKYHSRRHGQFLTWVTRPALPVKIVHIRRFRRDALIKGSMMQRPSPSRRFVSAGLLVMLMGVAAGALAADQPQWGQRHSRNMVSHERGLPDRFDPGTGKNVKWSASLGTACYSTPVVAGGRVLIGTNNSRPRDPRHSGDRGVLMCLSEADGTLMWQLVVPKLRGGPICRHLAIATSRNWQLGRDGSCRRYARGFPCRAV